MELRRRPYDHFDAVALTEQTQRYYVEIYGGPDSDPLTAASFEPPRGGFLLGYLGDRAVAMGGWHFTADTPLPDDAQIRRMFVDPTLRERGFGRALLAALEADAATHGARRMVLTTGPRQTGAVALYRSAGYSDVEPFGFYADKSGALYLGKELCVAPIAGTDSG